MNKEERKMRVVDADIYCHVSVCGRAIKWSSVSYVNSGLKRDVPFDFPYLTFLISFVACGGPVLIKRKRIIYIFPIRSVMTGGQGSSPPTIMQLRSFRTDEVEFIN